jgi:hypothetical protein
LPDGVVEADLVNGWAFDLRGKKPGEIEWGQFGANAAHVGR